MSLGQLSDSEVKRRASTGMFLVATWGLTNLVVGFVGNIVLARLLDPTAFGIVAIGGTVMIVATALADAGLGAGLIQRAESPAERELRTLTGIQLASTLACAALITPIALQFGETGAVVALMTLAMPIAAVQSAPRILLTREIRVGYVTAVEGISGIGFYVWSVGTVLLGAGVWGLATASIVRAAIGAIGMQIAPGGGLRRPSLSHVRQLGPLLTFGLKIQANWIVIVIRDQTRLAVTGAVGGLLTLGLWSFTSRLLLLPEVLFNSVSRVTFPALSHLMAAGHDPRPVVERATRLAATASSLMLAPLVGSAPAAVALLFGDKWDGVEVLIPPGALSVLIGGPVSAACVGFLYASGRPGQVLRASLAATVVVPVTAVLVYAFGLVGVGVAVIVGAVIESGFLARAANAACGAAVVRQMIVPLIAAVVSWSVGFAVASQLEPAPGAVAGGSIALLINTALIALFSRAALVDLVHVLRDTFSTTLGRREPAVT